MSSDKSNTDLYWAKTLFKPSDDYINADKSRVSKPISGGHPVEEMAIVDLSGNDFGADGDICGDGSKDDGPKNRAAMVQKRIATLKRHGYQFMRPLRYQDDTLISLWNIMGAFSDYTSTHGCSHILKTSGTKSIRLCLALIRIVVDNDLPSFISYMFETTGNWCIDAFLSVNYFNNGLVRIPLDDQIQQDQVSKHNYR